MESGPKKDLTFLEQIPRLEKISPLEVKREDRKLLLIIIQSIPIPILLRATSSESLIIPFVVEANSSLKDLFKVVNKYFKDNLDSRGLYFIKSNSKLIVSDQNH